MNGRLIKITVADGTVYANRQDEIQTAADIKEVAHPTQKDWAFFKVGRKNWSLTVGYLVGTGKVKTDLLKVGSVVTISVTENGKAVLSGQAIVTRCRISANIGSVVQGSFSFQGNGALT